MASIPDCIMSLVMLRWPTFLLLSALLQAEESMPRGIVRGSLVSWEDAAGAGALTVRNADGVVSGCSYDRHSYFERNHGPVEITTLSAGDPVEVVADRRPGSSVCYVRMLQVVLPAPVNRRPAAPRSLERSI